MHKGFGRRPDVFLRGLLCSEIPTLCQVNFVDRKDLLKVLQDQSEVAMRAARILSLEFQPTLEALAR